MSHIRPLTIDRTLADFFKFFRVGFRFKAAVIEHE